MKKLPLSADKVGLSKKLTLSDQIIWSFSQIKWVFLKKPTLSADNVGFSQIKCMASRCHNN